MEAVVNVMMMTTPTSANVTLDSLGKTALKVSNSLTLWWIHGKLLWGIIKESLFVPRFVTET